MNKSFKLLKRSEVGDTFTGRLFRWIGIAILIPFLFVPALFIGAVLVGIAAVILAIVVALSIVLIPVAILFRLLRLV